MDIHLSEVENRRDLRRFIYLPEKIHSGHSNWVHPIWTDEWKYFNPEKNEAFSYCETIRLLAFRGDEPVGRIMGIINPRYNEHRDEQTARWAYLETWKEREVIHALLERIEEWARAKDMTRIVGPYGFSDQDPEGYLIMGLEHRATIATYCNYNWMPGMIEDEGYTKDIDYFVYKFEVPGEVPDFYRKIHARVMKRGNFELMEFSKRRDLKPWVKPVLRLLNETYTGSDIYGYTPLDEKEMEALARRYLPILDPRFIKIVRVGDELVAFIIGMPDLTEGIQKARGRLLPFGVLKIIRAAKRTKQLDLLLGGIKEEYRGRGLDVLMGESMIISANKAGLETIDSHHEMETNTAVRAEMERMGGEVYKIFRVWQKDL